MDRLFPSNFAPQGSGNWHLDHDLGLDAWGVAHMSMDPVVAPYNGSTRCLVSGSHVAVGPYDASACRYAHVNLRLVSECVLHDPDAC